MCRLEAKEINIRRQEPEVSVASGGILIGRFLCIVSLPQIHVII